MRRPNTHEHAAYYGRYIELTRGANYLQLLRDSSDELIKILSTVSEEEAMYAYAEGKWTLKEMLQHIIDTDTVFAYRALCLSRFTTSPLAGFDQDEFVAKSRANERNIGDMLEDFKNMRAYLVGMFRGFNEAQLNHLGEMSGGPASALAIAFILSGHVFHHVALIKKHYL